MVVIEEEMGKIVVVATKSKPSLIIFAVKTKGLDPDTVL